MRAVFVGAGTLSVMTARVLLKLGHEVVVIERARDRIDELSSELDCGFVLGDGSNPAILREADPQQSDYLFCLTGNDQVNIIASLVGRSLQFAHVVTRIENPEFEHICMELGLKYTIIPDRTISRYLADMLQGHDPLEISAMVKHDARFFSFVVKADQGGVFGELDFPRDTRLVCLYRDGELVVPEDDAELRSGDEVVIITRSKHLAEIESRLGANDQDVATRDALAKVGGGSPEEK